MDTTYRDLFRKAILMRNHERRLKDYGRLPLPKKAFTRRPKAPVRGGLSAASLAEAFRHAADDALLGTDAVAGDAGTYIEAGVYFNAGYGDDALCPFVICRYYDGTRFHVERKAVLHDGTVQERGTDESTGECCVTGLPDDLPERFRHVRRAFLETVAAMVDLVIENRDVLRTET